MPQYGFNFQWMFSSTGGAQPQPPDERALDFLATYGFDFVRIPTSYWYWTPELPGQPGVRDYFHPNERVFGLIDRYLDACRKRRLHMSLNLHRAPGYCINRNDLEQHNLWVDLIAQDAFVFTWETFARRYRDVPSAALSFDLVNEPPAVGQYGMTRANHAAIMRRAAAAIRSISPDRPIVIDGLDGGNLAMPELADLGAVHSGRGYQPMPVSHHRATWWPDHAKAPPPVYPGLEWEGRRWDQASLVEWYAPWRAVQAAGVTVHVGEFGCYNQVDNDLALRWFADLLSVFREFGWGYALWGFDGPFGIVEHERPGTRYEQLGGYAVDRALLDLLLANRS